MRRTLSVHLFFATALAAVTACVPAAFGQVPTAPARPAAGGAPAAGAGARAQLPPGWNDVVATVTSGGQTEKITKGDVIEFMRNFSMPSDEPQEIYTAAVERVVNTRLLLMFLGRQRISISAAKVDAQIEQFKQQLKEGGQDLPTLLLQSNMSMDELHEKYEKRLRWTEYLDAKATEATLRKHLAERRDFFSNAMARVSHIMLKVEPNATPAEKEKVKQKLLSIKKEIESGALTFAAAANKYSEDPANAEGAGGDLDYISLQAGLVEEFTDAAFKLKKGLISDPVETPFGFHLIQVTDRKEGRLPDFDQNKVYIKTDYANQLQKTIVAAERKNAKIDIKPMPKDFFPPDAFPAASASNATGGTEKAKAAGAGGAAATPKN
jgi:peptidyl-prolyl cis-trans isomerase C